MHLQVSPFSEESNLIISIHAFKTFLRLTKIHTEGREFDVVMGLLKSNTDFFSVIPKAKTAKVVRNILNIVATVPDSVEIQVQLCKDVIEWCKQEKRTFLRQRIESKVCSCIFLLRKRRCWRDLIYYFQLGSLLLQQKDLSAALTLVTDLLGWVLIANILRMYQIEIVFYISENWGN